MFGPFKPTSSLSGGLLWKIPWRLSAPQKARQRKRLRAVDSVVACVDTALKKQGSSMKDLERWKAEMPREEEMRPKDKYTIFDRKEKRYRKGIHSESDVRLLLVLRHRRSGQGRCEIAGARDKWRGRIAIPLQDYYICSGGREMRVDTDEGFLIELPKWTRVSQRLNPPGF
ncbi:MAG: hypothetical protein Q9179_003369 [Wetmoreana sp. 5 TL-2023]